MHFHQQCGAFADRSLVVFQMRAIGRADFAQTRPRGS
jgi:hypothetical protein